MTERLRRVDNCGATEAQVLEAKRLIKRSSSRARYDSYFDVAPLYATAADLLDKPDRGEGELRQALVVLLRLTTLMRSGDLERTLPKVFVENGISFIHAVAKGGVCRAFAITGNALRATREYLAIINKREPPPTALVCYLGQNKPLRSEAISKCALKLMEAAGVDTGLFKGHALRGAAATWMLHLGVDKVAVQAKGGWASEESFIHNYARLHQRVDFDALFASAAASWRTGDPQPTPKAVGLLPDGTLCVTDAGRCSMGAEGKSPSVVHAVRGGSQSAAPHAPRDAGAEVEEEEEEGEDDVDREEEDERGDAEVQHATAQEAVQAMSSRAVCCGCSRRIVWEASTLCPHGERHFRCACAAQA